MERINIVDFEEQKAISKKNNKPYTYLEIRLDDGQKYRLYGDPAKVVEEGGVGFYEASFEPSPVNPKYQQISQIKAVGASRNNENTYNVPRHPQTKVGPSTDDSILYQVCLKAAAEIYASKSSSGGLASEVSNYAHDLFEAARKTLNPELDEVGF